MIKVIFQVLLLPAAYDPLLQQELVAHGTQVDLDANGFASGQDGLHFHAIRPPTVALKNNSRFKFEQVCKSFSSTYGHIHVGHITDVLLSLRWHLALGQTHLPEELITVRPVFGPRCGAACSAAGSGSCRCCWCVANACCSSSKSQSSATGSPQTRPMKGQIQRS